MTRVNEPISYFQKQQSVTQTTYQEGVCHSGVGRGEGGQTETLYS